MADAIALAALAKAGKAYSMAEQAESATVWIGVTTTALTDGSTTNPITVNNQSVTAKSGNIAQYSGQEYIWSGSAWQEFGGSNDFVVTFTKSGSTWSADKTTVNIDDAISAGKRVYGKVAGSSITIDSAFTGLSLLVPLNGDCGGLSGWQYGYSFGGSFQSGTSTIFVNFNIHTNPPLLNNSVTAYIKEVELVNIPTVTSSDDYKVLTALDGGWFNGYACVPVVYTVTGLPSDGVYPLSCDETLANIQGALTAQANIRAALTVGADTAILFPASTGSNYVSFSNLVQWNGGWSIFSVEHYIDGQDNEVCRGYIIPVNTTQMSYNTTSGELAITNVPEVSA